MNHSNTTAALFLSVILMLSGACVAHAQRWSDYSNFDAIPINLTRRVDGMQLGFWNVARRLDGFQLSYGCTQIADELNGMQLGIGSKLERQRAGRAARRPVQRN